MNPEDSVDPIAQLPTEQESFTLTYTYPVSVGHAALLMLNIFWCGNGQVMQTGLKSIPLMT